MSSLASRLLYWLVRPILLSCHRLGICAGPLAMRGAERLRWETGRWGAWAEQETARRRVPAYRQLLAAARTPHRVGPADFAAVPITDKASYIKAFPLEARCDGGRLPERGVVVDESSGTSGAPTNWVRGERERIAVRRSVSLGLREVLGRDSLFILNAFALGPWATGINLMLTLSSRFRMKAVGPDIAKIENTIREFGESPHYVVMGYPPFLKHLVDRAGIDWSRHRVSMCFGGEGMGESMRRYLQARGIRGVYGSYGASDLEINIAAETDVSIALRRAIESNPQLAQRTVRHPGAVPMIFQFNPAEFFLETTGAGELVVTICRPGYLAPKIRYNIHDLGHVMRFPEVASILAETGVSIDALGPAPLDLPFLFLYGRADQSVSYFGCKIPPADIQEVVFRLPNLAGVVDAFQLRTFEDEAGDKQLALSLELVPGAEAPDAAATAIEVFDALAVINQDFRESRRLAAASRPPFVEFFPTGTGPFAGSDIRVKRAYVAPA